MGIGKALRAIWAGLLDGYNELFPIVGMNVLWLVFNIPLAILGWLVIVAATVAVGGDEDSRSSIALVFSVLYAVLLVIGPNPAAAGIHLWSNRLVREERVEFSLFWQGLRTYVGKATVLFLISGVGLLLLISNALFYLRSDVLPLKIFGIVWVYGIVFWLTMQMFQLPLLIEQDDKRIRLVLRNSFFLAVANVVPSIVLLVLCTALVLVSLGLTLLIALLTGGVIALIEARALQLFLERFRSTATDAGSPTEAA